MPGGLKVPFGVMRQRTPPRANRKVSSSERLGHAPAGTPRLSGDEGGGLRTFWSTVSRVSFTISRSWLNVGTTTRKDTIPRHLSPLMSSATMKKKRDVSEKNGP